jgi:hypothetical protein
MSAFGIEEVLDDLESYLKSNLGTKLTSINTEKGDSLLVDINASAYHKQFIDSESNYDPFLIMGVIDPEISENIYAEVAQQYTIDVIIFFEQIDAVNDLKKAFRYQRALKELITEGFNDIYKRTKFNVSGLAPVTVQISKSQQHRATGVSLSVTLT